MSTNLASFLGKIQFARREFLYGIAAILIPQHSNASSENYRESFSQLLEFLESKYCFSHLKNINWQALNEIFAPRVAVASSEVEYSIILDDFFNEFCDPHTRLHNPPIGTRRTPPYDMFVALDNGNIVVRALLRNGAARLAGIKCGDIITGINGIPIEEAINAVKPKSIGAQISIETESYMFNQAVAGFRAQKRTIDIMRDTIAIKIEVELISSQAQQQPISSQSIGNDIGYIAIKSFAEESIISQFDALLEQFKNCKGLIIDVRDNGGGDTAIARPIKGVLPKLENNMPL